MATLNTNYTLLLNNYIGNFGGVNAYLRVYAKIERQDLVNNKSYVAIKEVIYASADYIYSGNNTYYLNSNIGNSGTKSGGFTFYAGETLINTVYAWANHNNDGTFTLTGSAGFTSTVWGMGTSGNYSATLPTIPRAATLTAAPNFNDEENPTITYSNPAGSVVESLQACIASTDGLVIYANYRDISKTGTSYTFELTDQERNNLRLASINSPSMTVKFYVKTVIGGNTYYSTLDRTLTIVNANPTFTSFNYEDVNNKTIALTGSSSKIVKGYSTLRVNNLVCNANKGATLQLIQINDIQYPYSENFTIDIENWASNNITIYVIDSRNNSTKLETLIGINFVNYTEKTITNKSCLRDGSINEESVLSFSGTFFNSSFGAVDNTLTASYKYKETSSTEWISGNTTLNLTINENNFSYEGYIKGDTNTGFSADKSFDIQITINDLLSERTTTLILAVGEPAIDIYKSNVAFGGIYDELENEYQAQFKKPTNFYSGVYKNGVEVATLNDIPSTLDIYSTNEIIVGTWIDGRPIYRKTINVGSASGNFTHPHGISNLDIIVNSYGNFLQGGTYREPLPKTTYANASEGWGAHIDDFTNTTFSLHFGTGIGTATKVFVILEYTKTTD